MTARAIWGMLSEDDNAPCVLRAGERIEGKIRNRER